MPVLDIECQLARGQIARYLDGASFPGESLLQLEEHISECEACRSMLMDRRSLLEAKVSKERTVRAVAEVQASQEPFAVPSPKVSLWTKTISQFGMKPFVLVGALVVVLLSMSAVSKNMTGFLGPKVALSPISNQDSTPAASLALKPIEASSPTTAPAKSEALSLAQKPVENAKSISLAISEAKSGAVVPLSTSEPKTPVPNAAVPSTPKLAPSPKSVTTPEPVKTVKRKPTTANSPPIHKASKPLLTTISHPVRPRLRKRIRNLSLPNHVGHHRRAKRTAWSSGIRVYEPNGNLVN